MSFAPKKGPTGALDPNPEVDDSGCIKATLRLGYLGTSAQVRARVF